MKILLLLLLVVLVSCGSGSGSDGVTNDGTPNDPPPEIPMETEFDETQTQDLKLFIEVSQVLFMSNFDQVWDDDYPRRAMAGDLRNGPQIKAYKRLLYAEIDQLATGFEVEILKAPKADPDVTQAALDTFQDATLVDLEDHYYESNNDVDAYKDSPELHQVQVDEILAYFLEAMAMVAVQMQIRP